MTKPKTMLQIGLAIVDELLEKQFFPKLIQPFLKQHEVFYGEFNVLLRKVLDDNKRNIPAWFTANAITYARTWVVFPTLLLLAWDYTWWPAFLVVLVDFGDFLDGVVARFWADVRKEEEAKLKKSDGEPKKNDNSSTVEILPSLARQQRDTTYGGFVDAVCDKAYIVPCWISLTRVAASMERLSGNLAMFTLFCLILAETASACIRFRAFFTTPGVAAPPTAAGFDFSTSAVKADHVGKAKQTFQMIGTALFILNWTRRVGLALLLLSLPLAYESVRRKVKNRVIFVPYQISTSMSNFSHTTLHFWMQAKALGASQLLIGVTSSTAASDKDAIANARSCSAVDQVMVHSTTTLDETFLDQHEIDYILLALSGATFDVAVAPELFKSQRVLILGADGMVRPLTKSDTVATKKDE